MLMAIWAAVPSLCALNIDSSFSRMRIVDVSGRDAGLKFVALFAADAKVVFSCYFGVP